MRITAGFRLRTGHTAALDGILVKFRTTHESGTTVTNDAVIACHNNTKCPGPDDRTAQVHTLRALAVRNLKPAAPPWPTTCTGPDICD